jgi:hypothetical protein
MIRFLILVLGMLTTRTGRLDRASFRAEEPSDWSEPDPRGGSEVDDDWIVSTEPPVTARYARPAPRTGPARSDWSRTSRSNRRRWVPPWVKWAAGLAVAGLVFRKAIAFLVIATLSAALHLIGLDIHLPSIKFAWPWQSIAAGTTTDTEIGPWVLQRIEGISKPALGTENFNFVFTHKVTKNIGIWPCWYSSTFYAVGHASATVDLNPGPSWWAPKSGHYELQILSRPVTGSPGRVAVTIVLPKPQLPQSVHDITVDNTLSHPIDTQHSWTYPGLGCGALIKPQFSVSVLYGEAQNLAFYQATHNPQVTRPLIAAAESEATQIIRNNFIQPTVNALGYSLTRFTLRWSGAP